MEDAAGGCSGEAESASDWIGRFGVFAMSLVVVVGEERFREALEGLTQEAGYALLNLGNPGGDRSLTVGRALAQHPDLAVVASERAGSEWIREFDQTDTRYWLLTVGSPEAAGLARPVREPHRRVLSLNQTSAAYLRQLLDDWRDREQVQVDFFTFGFRYGLPAEADWVVDTRFLDSPYWVPEMRDLPGSDPAVRRHMMSQPGAQTLVDSFLPMLLDLVPLYRSQRRSVLRVAVGCTGGKHRSVAIASELVDRVNKSGRATARHLEHPPLSVPQALD
jgi:hypothetical protein